MGLAFDEKLSKGLKKVELMVKEADVFSGSLYTLEMIRLTQYRDVLVKAYGDKTYKEDFENYIQNRGFQNYIRVEGYTRDYIYSIVKELEFRKTNVAKTEELEEGYGVLLELYSEIFNHWKSYNKMLEGEKVVEKKVPKTRAERRKLGL